MATTTFSKMPRNKALDINRDNQFYGSFAEIGAGQEVARHFFQAGLASQTVAKSISAYDKTFSDAIYGKGSRFVSEDRLMKMLEHEFQLLQDRLPERKSTTRFFTYANTVTTSSHEDESTCHGWMGIRFQLKPDGPINDIVMHVRMLDRLRLQQQESLGVLGVNLIYAAFRYTTEPANSLIKSLIDSLSKDRIEIDFIRFKGPDIEHFDNRIMSLELVHHDISRAVLFNPQGQTVSGGDAFYKKPVLIQRGTFRPFTMTNQLILENGLEQMKSELGVKENSEIISVAEITMSNLKTTGNLDQKDFLDRVDTITAMGHYVLVSNFPLFAQLKKEIRRHTENLIGIVVGASALNGLFDESYYTKFPGGIISAFGQLFDAMTKMYVYPYKTDKICATASTFNPKGHLSHILKYLFETGRLCDLQNCDTVDTALHSEDVRKLLSDGNPDWEKLVPEKVKEIVIKRQLFGYGATRSQ